MFCVSFWNSFFQWFCKRVSGNFWTNIVKDGFSMISLLKLNKYLFSLLLELCQLLTMVDQGNTCTCICTCICTLTCTFTCTCICTCIWTWICSLKNICCLPLAPKKYLLSLLMALYQGWPGVTGWHLYLYLNLYLYLYVNLYNFACIWTLKISVVFAAGALPGLTGSHFYICKAALSSEGKYPIISFVHTKVLWFCR